MGPIKLYWCRGSGRKDPNRQNFGDYLSADIVEFVSGKKVEHAPVKSAELIAIGSVLGREKKAKIWGFPRKLHIWGAGTADSQDLFSSRHYYHAVRGKKCASRIQGSDRQPVLGDPGLLSSSLVNRPLQKNARIGIIPHINHRASPTIKALLQRLPGSKVIDVYSPVKQVLSEIAACEFVLSTSLHGLIVADSYGVPNQWMVMERNANWEFKFQDYYSAFGIHDPAPVTADQILQNPTWSVEACIGDYLRPGLGDIQENLIKAFPAL
ncbi:polysaccharide pyruvyl transferase family protein [Pseudomonas sp. Teo4]|uniref:polysaccharide pyruvyl transferase family protein n=1 Tax=Pseudomonas sp. Teo4 TaxID=3064528 RepID=UPI002AB889CA|nr:polysaccharide pyruvyl transferase family protein [Pseudomonas sp. Teo4]MDZ3991409.1 hypothetical protein [Pseudomonas sp. Teo4]